MKQDLQKTLAHLQPVVDLFKRYHATLFIVFFLGIYGFLVVQIGDLVNSNPPQSAIDEKKQTIKSLKIDEEAIDRILLLEEQNIEVRSLFQRARNNPFTE